MLFRSYNNAKGIWACELDSFFFFLAYLTFAFVFSFLSTVLIESPCHNLWREFVLKMPDPIYASFKQYNQRSKQAFEDKMGSSIFTTNSDECESLDQNFADESPTGTFEHKIGKMKKKSDKDDSIAQFKAANRPSAKRRLSQEKKMGGGLSSGNQ